MNRIGPFLLAAILPGVAALASPAVAPAGQEMAISGAFALETPPGAKVGGAFMTISNIGAQEDRLISASAPGIAEKVEIHSMKIVDGIARMRPAPAIIPPHASLALEPGGLHLMLLGLTGALTPGRTMDIALEFEHAGKMLVSVPIRARLRASAGETP